MVWKSRTQIRVLLQFYIDAMRALITFVLSCLTVLSSTSELGEGKSQFGPLGHVTRAGVAAGYLVNAPGWIPCLAA